MSDTNRRGFLKLLFGGAAAAAVVPLLEKLPEPKPELVPFADFDGTDDYFEMTGPVSGGTSYSFVFNCNEVEDQTKDPKDRKAKWQHCLMTMDQDKNTRAWIDGAEITKPTTLMIDKVQGDIAEIMMWNKELTEKEAVWLYDAYDVRYKGVLDG